MLLQYCMWFTLLANCVICARRYRPYEYEMTIKHPPGYHYFDTPRHDIVDDDRIGWMGRKAAAARRMRKPTLEGDIKWNELDYDREWIGNNRLMADRMRHQYRYPPFPTSRLSNQFDWRQGLRYRFMPPFTPTTTRHQSIKAIQSPEAFLVKPRKAKIAQQTSDYQTPINANTTTNKANRSNRIDLAGNEDVGNRYSRKLTSQMSSGSNVADKVNLTTDGASLLSSLTNHTLIDTSGRSGVSAPTTTTTYEANNRTERLSPAGSIDAVGGLLRPVPKKSPKPYTKVIQANNKTNNSGKVSKGYSNRDRGFGFIKAWAWDRAENFEISTENKKTESKTDKKDKHFGLN